MGESADYYDSADRFTDYDQLAEGDQREYCHGDMVRVPGTPRDNKRYRCQDCGAIRQRRAAHLTPQQFRSKSDRGEFARVKQRAGSAIEFEALDPFVASFRRQGLDW